MKFFKFIGEDDKSLAGGYGQAKIHYVKGEKIEVKETNMDKTVQCSSGIHCIYMEGSKPISPSSILFGPKVAILETAKENVVYFAEDGKCRLSKCKVINIIPTNQLSIQYLTGNGNKEFLRAVEKYINDLKIDKNSIQKILNSKLQSYEKLTILNELSSHITEYDEYLEQQLIKGNAWELAKNLSIKHGVFFDPKIRKSMLSEPYVDTKINWTLKFGKKQDIENSVNLCDIPRYVSILGTNSRMRARILKSGNMNDIINYAMQYSDDEIESIILPSLSDEAILRYAIKHNRNTPEITKRVYDIFHKSTSWYNPLDSLRNEYIKKFFNDEGVEDIALLSVSSIWAYSIATKKLSEKAKEMLGNNRSYAIEAALTFGYDAVIGDAVYRDTSTILEMTKKYGINENFLDNAMTYVSYSTYPQDILKAMKEMQYNQKLEELFLLHYPSINYIIEYCAHFGYTLNIEKYLEKQFKSNFWALINAARKFGYFPFMSKMLDIILDKETSEDEKEKFNKELLDCQSIFFKVIKVLNNGTQVSSMMSKESKKRKIYRNAGESRPVDKGMVFNNYFSAKKYIEIYSFGLYLSNGRFQIMRCTGENFKPVDRTININHLDSFSQDIIDGFYNGGNLVNLNLYSDFLTVELPGSGWLENIIVEDNISYYF